MIKLKHILTEKREFPADGITVISLATDRNEHTKARLTLAKVMKNKKFIGIYKAIENIQDIERFFPSELRKYRDSVDKELFKQSYKMYSDHDIIVGVF